MAEQIPATMITLTRVEGLLDECGTVWIDGGSLWRTAEAILDCWAQTAPDGGYHKIDFSIDFANGETYKGRYDLSQDRQADSPTLAAHLREIADVSAGQPTLSAEQRAAYAHVLETYALDDPSPRPASAPPGRGVE